jgi:hypothetical protein
MKCRYQREAGSVGTCDTVQKVGEKKRSFGKVEVDDGLAFAGGRGEGEGEADERSTRLDRESRARSRSLGREERGEYGR